MRSLKSFVIAAAASLVLIGCASTLSGLAGPPTVAEAKTVAAAEVAYTEAARFETLWLNSGKATKAQATVAKSLEGAVYADVVIGRTAIANNDSAAVAVALKLFNQALPEFRAYLTKAGASP